MTSHVHGKHFSSFLPTALMPFPDETVGSIAARYHLWECNKNIKKSLIELFGTTGILPNAALPTRLAHLCKVLGCSDSNASAAVMSLKHTLLPYFTFFGMRDQMANTAIATSGPYFPKATAGLLACTFGAADVLRYCPACAKADSDLYGVAYWRRSHQLPEVAICHLHLIPLKNYLSSKELRQRHALPLPPGPSAHDMSLVVTQSEKYRFQVQFAISSATLLTAEQTKLSLKNIVDAYKDRLITRGLARKSGRVDQAALRSEICEHYRNFDFLSEHYRLIVEDGPLPWLERIVRKPRTRQHPILHLILTNFLFSGPVELVEYISKTKPKRHLVKAHPNEPDGSEMLSRFFKEGISLRQTSRLLGTTVTTLKVRATAAGLAVDRRPKYISQAFEALMLAELAKGEMVEAISKRFNVSIVSVYRTLRSNPQVKLARHEILFNKELMTRRDLFKESIGGSGVSVINARTAAPNEYKWLWRNDRAWLVATLKKRSKKRKLHTPRVDWEVRDEALLEEVHNVVNSIRNSNGKPIRVTINEIGRRTRKTSLLQKRLSKLPRTADLLSTSLESTYSFQKRRVHWAITTQTGCFASVSAIARVAGISDLRIVKNMVDEYRACMSQAQS